METFDPNKHIATNLQQLESQGLGWWEDGQWHHWVVQEVQAVADKLAHLVVNTGVEIGPDTK